MKSTFLPKNINNMFEKNMIKKNHQYHEMRNLFYDEIPIFRLYIIIIATKIKMY